MTYDESGNAVDGRVVGLIVFSRAHRFLAQADDIVDALAEHLDGENVAVISLALKFIISDWQ